MSAQPSIKEVEELVGRKAHDVIVRERDIVIVFGGSRTTNEEPVATGLTWHIPRKLSTREKASRRHTM